MIQGTISKTFFESLGGNSLLNLVKCLSFLGVKEEHLLTCDVTLETMTGFTWLKL